MFGRGGNDVPRRCAACACRSVDSLPGTSLAEPVFVLHVFALGVFNVFVVREVNAVGALFAKCAVAILLPMTFAVFIRRFAAPVSRLLFGGR